MATPADYNKLARRTALFTFTLGSILILLFYFTMLDSLPAFSALYIVVAGLINFILVIFFAVKKVKAINIAMVLANIPVAIIYILFAAKLMNTHRITLTNTTSSTVTGIQFMGCAEKSLDLLEPGESETFWIPIDGDCSISLNCVVNGEPKYIILVEYTTATMGSKFEYVIAS